MHFAFAAQQLEFRDQLRALAGKLCPPLELRQAWEGELGWSPERWRALAELGVTSITVPEVHGGMGLGFVDLVLLLEEAGRSGLPEPLLDTAVASFLLCEAPGAEELCGRWMPQVMSGEAALGVEEPGSAGRVQAGTSLVVLERAGVLYAQEQAGASTGRLRSVDGARRFEEVVLHATEASALAEGEQARRLLCAAYDRGATGAAAVLVGAAGRMIAMAAEYAGQRTQFGRPIGSFEAVKHHLAGALVRTEFARPLVYRAAWSLDHRDEDASRHCSMAKTAASDAASLAARVALQVHGAIGYTWEHDLHLWMKRAWALAGAWGDGGWHRSRLLGLVDW